MTTVLIIVCIVLCVGVVLAITGHLGIAIVRDKERHLHLQRVHKNAKVSSR